MPLFAQWGGWHSNMFPHQCIGWTKSHTIINDINALQVSDYIRKLDDYVITEEENGS